MYVFSGLLKGNRISPNDSNELHKNQSLLPAARNTATNYILTKEEENFPKEKLEAEKFNISDVEELPLPSPPTQLLPVESTAQLAKINIVEELVQYLRSQDANKRRKVIWDLAQQGDSRAIQPLVDLMANADTQQRSLILAALAEIPTRTLKPLNRALAVSLQDESLQVRQNTIRDLTRLYDLMLQVSHMVYSATEDRNSEVQATPKYTMGQMNQICSLPPELSSKSPNPIEG